MQHLINRDKCPLCHNDKTDTHIPFPEIPIVKCSDCSFLFSSNILPEDDMTNYYETTFGSQRHMQGQIVNAKINSWVIDQFINLKNIGNILDVGTGYGFLLKDLIDKHNIKSTGVELSLQEASYAQNKLNLNVINKSLCESGLEKNQYDLVTSFEVIEHITDPISFIQEMTEYVKPGGYLLIMTDNFDSRVANSLGAGFPKWIPHSHISHFSPGTLKSAIESAGNLTIISSKSYTPWEIHARDIYYKLFSIKKTPFESFNLKSTLKSEMGGTYKLFHLRRLINKIWTKSTLSNNMDGALMFFLSKKETN